MLDLQHFEDDQLYDQLQRARQQSSSRPYQILTRLLSLLSQGISVGSIAVVLFSWNVWLGLLILLSPLPSFYTRTVFANKTYTIQRARAKELRGLFYLQQLVTTAASVKEVRLFRLGSLFLARYRERFDAFFRVLRSGDLATISSSGHTWVSFGDGLIIPKIFDHGSSISPPHASSFSSSFLPAKTFRFGRPRMLNIYLSQLLDQ